MSGATWDASAGVWAGDKAAGGDEEIPSPLIIFGYGSLCWKPDSTLESFQSFPGYVRGWARVFAQRSTDHRGTPGAPGLVATLLEDKVCTALPAWDEALVDATGTLGRAYIVPEDYVTKVLDELDFREKGGYTRRVVEVERLDGQASVRALVYSATVENPNFWWGENGSGLDLDACASILATAVGPSGPNVDYLSNLHGFLEEQGVEDKHVQSLLRKVLALSPPSSN